MSLAATPTFSEPSAAEILEAIAASDDPDEVVRQRLRGETPPLVFGEEFLFLARAEGSSPPRIVGDFNDGGYARSEVFGNGTMQRVGSTAWFALRVPVGRDARFEYQLAVGNLRSPDPLNPDLALTYGSRRSVAVGPDSRSAPLPLVGASRGRIEILQFSSRIRKNTRPIHVYRPPGAGGGNRLPTLYVKDGDLFRRDAAMPALIDTLIARGMLPPMFVVFLVPIDRATEYGTSADYRQLVINELVPFIETRFETGGAASQRGLLGASRAGLAAVDLALRHSDVFGFAAALSPAIRPVRLIDQIAEATADDAKFFVLLSRFDTPALIEDGRLLAGALRHAGHRVNVIEAPIDHSINAWAHWIDLALSGWNLDR
ncbi:MAG: alpha/beta hydrolase-fold protein [Pseudomonadota bacterium]